MITKNFQDHHLSGVRGEFEQVINLRPIISDHEIMVIYSKYIKPQTDSLLQYHFLCDVIL